MLPTRLFARPLRNLAGKPDPPLISAGRRRVFVWIAGALAGLGIAAGLASLFRAPPSPTLVHLWALGPAHDWGLAESVAERDHLALRAGGYFDRWYGLPTEMVSKRHLEQQLAVARNESDDRPLIIYLQGRAATDSAGDLILTTRATPFDRAIRFHDLLVQIRDCPSSKKLLVLDLLAPPLTAAWAADYREMQQQVRELLDRVEDPHRLTLCNSSPGERPLYSELWGRSGFGYFLERGLSGRADGCLDRVKDARVSVAELAHYLQVEVGRWARVTHGRSQSPALVGAGKNFELVGRSTRQMLTQGTNSTLDSPPIAAYPGWLEKQWEEYLAARENRKSRFHSALLHEWESSLLRAEGRWRAGRESVMVEAELARSLSRLKRRVNSLRASERQLPRDSIFRFEEEIGLPGMSVATAALTRLLGDWDAKIKELPAAEWSTVRSGLLKEFQTQNKDVDENAIVAAAIGQLEELEGVFPGHIQFLDELVRHYQPQPLFVETLFLRRLAGVARRTPSSDWPSEIVGRMIRLLRTADLARPTDRTFPWLAAEFSAAAQHQHNAEYLLFRPGFAAETELTEAVDLAEHHFQRAAIAQTAFRDAYETMDTAFLVLPVLTQFAPWLDSRGNCVEAAEAAAILADQLNLGAVPAESPPVDLTQLAAGIGAQQLRLQELLDELTAPFHDDALNRIIRRAVDVSPPSRIAKSARMRVGAGPQFKTVALRPRLADRDSDIHASGLWWTSVRRCGLRGRSESGRERWRDPEPSPYGHGSPIAIRASTATATLSKGKTQVAFALELRLAWPGLTVSQRKRILSAKRELDADLHAALSSTDSTASLQSTRVNLEHDSMRRQSRRRTRQLSLLRLGGVSDLYKRRTASGKGEITWPTVLHRADELLREADEWNLIRLATILPSEQPAGNLRQSTDAATVAYENSLRTRRAAWFASHYAFRAADDTPLLNAELARRFAEHGGSSELGILRFRGPTEVSLPRRENEYGTPQTEVQLEWQVRGGDPGNESAEAAILAVNGFDIDHEATPTPDGAQLNIKLTPTSPAPDQVGATGIVVRVAYAGRSWHRQLAFATVENDRLIELRLARDLDSAGESVRSVRLRPSRQSQAFHLLLVNHASELLDAIVELPGFAKGRVSVPANSRLPVCLQPLDADHEAWSNTAERSLIVRDSQTSAIVLKQTMAVEVVSPAEYVRVRGCRFVPSASNGNRLEVTLQAEAMPPGPPCQVELELDGHRINGFTGITGGSLRGILPQDGSPVTLTAEGLLLREGASEAATFSVGVDGVPGAFEFAATFPRRGDPTTPQMLDEPRVSVVAPDFVNSAGEVLVSAKAFRLPTSGTLRFSIDKPSASGFKQELSRVVDARPVEEVQAAITSRGQIAFAVGLRDYQARLDTSGLMGKRIISATAFDSRGQAVARDSRDIWFDFTPPEQAFFAKKPQRQLAGEPIEVEIVGRDNVSGVAAVTLFVGEPVADAIPAGASQVQAVRSQDATNWHATLPPVTIAGPLKLTARIENRVGLATFVTTSILVVDTLGPVTGSLQGIVSEGPRLQPQLPVTLLDGNRTVVQQVVTDPDGRFFFQGLTPGDYSIAASKRVSGRRAQQAVKVEAGKTADVTLQLAL